MTASAQPFAMSPAPKDGLWLGIGELAACRRRDKATISRNVARLEAEGLLTSCKGPRGRKLVNLAAFDRAMGIAFAEKSLPPLAGSDGADARRAAYMADLAGLDLAERRGQLMPTGDVVAAAATCAEVIRLALAQLPCHADALAEAVQRDGAQGARACLEALARDLQLSIESRLVDLAASDEGAGR